MTEDSKPKYKLNADKNDPKFIEDGMNELERNTKRIIDFFTSFFCLILFSPLFLICYIAVKREDGGPAIFKQERIGRFGRPFYIYKFRSMRVDAEKNGPALYQHDNETRMTKVGKFLREHHLDELPQLWNVFMGEMAFIGPRPERKYYIDQIIKEDPRYVYLYQVRPGVTSYATLYNGYTDTMEKMLRRLELDLYYLEHRSLWFDFKLLVLTFLNIAFGKKF
jgi:lipopolysaccharide/colanic/teichoic acid biosynthesis glycosyltransferase